MREYVRSCKHIARIYRAQQQEVRYRIRIGSLPGCYFTKEEGMQRGSYIAHIPQVAEALRISKLEVYRRLNEDPEFFSPGEKKELEALEKLEKAKKAPEFTEETIIELTSLVKELREALKTLKPIDFITSIEKKEEL